MAIIIYTNGLFYFLQMLFGIRVSSVVCFFEYTVARPSFLQSEVPLLFCFTGRRSPS